MKKKGLFKNAAVLLMSCAMAVSSLPVTAFAFQSEREAAAEPTEAQESVYVLMNIPYADFYRAEVGNNEVAVDAMSSATKAKTKTGTLAGGSYHVNADGTDISGITFPVMLGEGVEMSDLAAYTEVTDASSLEITVTNRGQTTTTTYSGKDALFESGNYSYYRMSETPSYYKVVTKEENKLVFGRTVGEAQVLNNVRASFTTDTGYGDYQLDLEDETLNAVDQVYGVVLSTEEGYGYGLRHVENIWRISKLAWCTGFTEQVHNCPTSSAHYLSMMGKKINKVTYFTSDGIFEIPLDSIYVPIKFENQLSVADASAASGRTTISTGTLPSGYDPAYQVEELEGASVNGTELTFPKDSAIGQYTLTVSDRKGVYAGIGTTFTLYTESLPVSYSNVKKALVSDDQNALMAYVKNITSVSVDGKEYAASGRGAVTLIQEDGTLVTDAEPFSGEADSFQVEVTATGYKKNLAFTYAKVNAEGLKTAIAKAKALKESDYTAQTWKTVKDKLAQAEDIFSSQSSQADVDRAAAELNAAVQKLEKAAEQGDGQTPGQTSVKVGEIYKAGKLRYKVTKAAADGTGTVEVYAPADKKAASLTIPGTVTIEKISFQVTAIGAGAFRKCTGLKKIVVGVNVTKIGKNAFQGDKKLKAITVKSKKLTSIGKAALKGISTKAVIKVPKSKRAAYKKLFRGKGQGKKVVIK